MGLTQITTGGVDDNINIDSNTLKVDGTNNRVGIGEASPSATLHANSGTTDVVADFESTDANAWIQIRDNSTTDTAVMVGAVGDDMRLRAGSNERVRIDSSGNVGIATADPKDALHVSGNIRAAADAGGRLILEDANQGDSSIPFYLFASDNGNLTFTSANRNASGGTTGSSERMRIDSSGRLLLGTTSSVGDDNNLQVVGSTADASSATFWRSSSDAGNPSINFVKTRGSVASPSIVSSGDILGHIRFNGYDGTDHNSRAAEIKSEVDGTPGTNDMPGRLVFSTTADGASSPTERMRIDSSGNVGIGTTSIASGGAGSTNLNVHTPSATSVYLKLSNSSTGNTSSDGFDLSEDSSGNAYLINRENGNMQFYTNATERMRIGTSGDIGVNTSTLSNYSGYTTIRVNNNTNGGVFEVSNNNVIKGQLFYDGTQTRVRANLNTDLVLDTHDTERMRIDSSGDVLIGTTSNAAHANADNLIVGSTSGTHQGITINGSSSSQIRFADSANNSIGYLIYNHGSNKLEFGCNGAEGFIVTQNRFIQTGGYTNNSAQYHRINGRDQTQGTNFLVLSGYQSSNGSSGDTAYFYSCNTGTGPNGAATAFSVFRNALTSRSINAAGTINASGADYAEYMTKAGNFTLAKGDICGINSEGKLTNVFADAISFVVKSTDPSYVGGDTWHTAAGVKPGGAGDDRTEEEIAAATVVYEEALETARQLVDRIAFSGQVPVNVTGATPGQHIIPTAAADGSIEGTAKAEADLTMAEYMSSVGKVIAIEDDGRAKIIVKVA